MIIHALLTAQLAASRCIFIIATPGSGSSFMRTTVENRTGCVMSGENWGALLQLSEVHRLIVKTETQPRPNQHSEDAWKKYFRLADVIAAEHHLVATMLNPDDRSCWGYKDIHVGRKPSRHATFVSDLQYLAKQCVEPRFLFHTRRSLARELESKIISRSSYEARATEAQWECFQNYCNVSRSNVSKSSICRLPPGTRAVPTFWHTLEDMLENNRRHELMWRFLSHGAESAFPFEETATQGTHTDRDSLCL